MTRLAVLGASGHGKVVADIAECCGWRTISFFDDAWPVVQVNGHWPVVGKTSTLIGRLPDFDGVIVAIGNNSVRYSKLIELRRLGAKLITLAHPTAVVSCYAEVGSATVIMAGAVVNTSASLGLGCIVNTGCSVDHDCVLGDAVHISPGARLAGGTVVGERSWIGIGANVCHLIRIGRDSIVGAGAAVVRDVPDNVTVVGVPARIVQR